ncbi:hypothetical protein BO94DRAFT_133702 [Aspergillus sclerotioniger CBS 115572]|uniref:Uncharacterized protein n=1 Tax=Aspergillus sclerotioniger CBS 115572 TaxID=1450535 RepID=A0A317XC64_9EURO|nr:hypothetical protein BO94DRAFT_133702 [Aspergillus sclerotioniger CBS 115572]PWY95691.1 hypothetical protein BO94DRAFT_133702 [Aspergillus sclerotioniger CBS 115572]
MAFSFLFLNHRFDRFRISPLHHILLWTGSESNLDQIPRTHKHSINRGISPMTMPTSVKRMSPPAWAYSEQRPGLTDPSEFWRAIEPEIDKQGFRAVSNAIYVVGGYQPAMWTGACDRPSSSWYGVPCTNDKRIYIQIRPYQSLFGNLYSVPTSLGPRHKGIPGYSQRHLSTSLLTTSIVGSTYSVIGRTYRYGVSRIRQPNDRSQRLHPPKSQGRITPTGIPRDARYLIKRLHPRRLQRDRPGWTEVGGRRNRDYRIDHEGATGV